ncbi:MAG: type II toxin-antitoxin system RelB/DinJ family antitoxin [Verrucomicrobiaceae bacterium]|nr:MAG: type II toxin-antitoxin system RelB/DinJ family antitoxin [Verrucomicrobiaceae bacterium]
MAIKNIQLRIDEGLKNSAEIVLEELGLDMPTALRLFLKKVVKTKAIPFRISLEDESGESFTRAQIREILASRKEARDPAKLSGPFKSLQETQGFLDSLKQK